ncbi:four-carbon acid sugar kinase family protein [Streptosporangium sp. NPDC000396]|uniref:four-carbon acid sugar kinase family protein n=1 Tax=Streptosporangium sp. NPDC000396 TaxID=3366185 RepID=UPI003674402C
MRKVNLAASFRSAYIALIADDLTSAADGAAPFRAAGLPARITLEPSPGPSPHGVTALDIDTRAGSASAAAARTADAVAALAEADVLIKTVDSTLRGHLAAEIGAALSSSGRATAVIAPAFPAEGRTTWNGVQSVAGRPVHETSFAHDPGHPVRCSDLGRLLTDAVVVGAGRQDRLAALVGAVPYVVVDAASDRHLDELVTAVSPDHVLWVGSPGLAAALARRMSPGERPAVTAPAPPRRPRVLLVVGSLNPASQEQVARFRSGGGAAVCVTADRAVEQAAQALSTTGAVVLYGSRIRGPEALVPERLAETTARLAVNRAFDAMLLTGGETARAVLHALGARDVELIAEPEPGVPVGLIERPYRLPIVLKAGGFGNSETLVRLRDLLTTTTFVRYPCDL